MIQLIKNEIASAKKSTEAYIYLKLNNIVDAEMIRWLYNASQNGVKLKLNVRSMFSMIAGKTNMSENIEAISIVDKFLEHSRILIFANAGNPLYFISSADWMARNLDRRVEATCPIYDDDLKKELQNFFDIQWQDNIRARVLNEKQDNTLIHNKNLKDVRAQWAIYDYLKSKC
jgi:polyphosphate kinase